jgi:dTDP-4-amino-4,6-dideoxygalactose transaminase
MILMNDFAAEPAELIATELAAVERVRHSGWYILGREVEAFERAFAAFCEVPECVGVGNGLDAIEIGLRAQGIGPGEEVITTPMTAFATVLAIIRAGATPVLADIDPNTGLLDLESVQRCLSPRTRGVLLVHLYGRMPDMTQWVDFCRSARIHLWEDCAQAHGAQWASRQAGTWGEWGAYSFYPTKNLGAWGDGGALVCRDSTVAARARSLRNYGQSDRYNHPILGLNSRLDEIHAAILAVRLNWLSRFNERRNEIASRYYANLRNKAFRLLAPPEQNLRHVYHLFVLLSDVREDLQKHLREGGIQSQIHYPVPVHRQPPCRNVRTDPKGLSKVEEYASACLSLPCHPQLSDPAVNQVIERLNAF